MIRWRHPATLLVGALLIALLAPAPRAASQDSPPLKVEVTRLEPLLPQRDGILTIGGTVSNTSAGELADVRVRLRVSPSPLVSRSQAAAVTERSTSRTGVAVEGSSREVAARLAPGKKAEFLLTTETSALPLGPNGVYAMFVEALAGGNSARAPFPIVWIPDPGSLTPSRLVVAAPVRGAVDLTAEGRLRSGKLVEQLSPGGGLHGFATAGSSLAESGVPITWLVDPAVTDAAAAIAAGSVDLPLTAGDPKEGAYAAARWSAELAAGLAAPGSRVFHLPYAEVDGPSVIAAGLPGLLDESLAASSAPTGTPPSTPEILAPIPGGGADTGILEAYARGSVTAVLMSDAAMPPAPELTYTPSGAAEIDLPDGRRLQALLWDRLLAEQWDRQATTPEQRLRIQLGVLAQTAMITLELPLEARTVLMLPPRGRKIPGDLFFGTIATLAGAPFVELVGLETLLDLDESPRVPRSQPSPLPGSRQLPPAYFRKIPQLQQRLTTFEDVTVDPSNLVAQYQAAILRASSANWRSDIKGGEGLLASLDAELGEAESLVTTVSIGNVTFTGSRGTLPITISNGLDQAVRIGVELQAEPAFRLAYTAPEPLVVEAGRRVSVEIPVEIYGSGPVPLAVVLTDASGKPFVRSTELTLRSAGARLLAASIAAIGAVALIALLAWRFHKRGAEVREPRH